MACETDNMDIDDRQYSVTQWPADKAIIMKLKIIKVIGAAFSLIADAHEDDINGEQFSKAIESLFHNNTPESIAELIKDCVIGAACDGNRITASSFNELFSGDKLIEAYRVFFFVIKVNYQNLFKGQVADRYLAKLKNMS